MSPPTPANPGKGKFSQKMLDALEKDFEIGSLVEFVACSGSLFEIVAGDSPFWTLEHFGGPLLPDNYHETCFGKKAPHMEPVIETVLQAPNAMEVLAIMRQDSQNE